MKKRDLFPMNEMHLNSAKSLFTPTNTKLQNVNHDLDPNHLTLRWCSWKIFFEKKSADDSKRMKNYPACKNLKDKFHAFVVKIRLAFTDYYF